VFCAVFAYDVAERGAFERVYGPDGECAAFFRGGAGYLGTELLAAGDGRSLLIDRWASRDAYEAFLATHREEYERRSAETAGLYLREERVGEFETAPSPPALDSGSSRTSSGLPVRARGRPRPCGGGAARRRSHSRHGVVTATR
jgi:hypothetical protein